MKAELHIVINDEMKMGSGYKLYTDNELEKHSLRLLLIGELNVTISNILEDDKPFRNTIEREI
jgi:cytochrome c1